MNFLIYLIPFMFGILTISYLFIYSSIFYYCFTNLLLLYLLVDVVLSKVHFNNLQTLFIGIYIAIYLIPVGYVVFYKLKVNT